jgi:membrane protease YdiL (CAAX protease family)
LPDNEWSRERQARERFKFELQHGDAAQAEAAYRKLRENGFEADPFLGRRIQLLLKHPAAGWAWGDLGPALCLLLLLSVAACLPLLVLVPVHYWSLLRQRAGRTVEWLPSPWGLRAAWLMMAAMAVGMTLGAWLANPDLLMPGHDKAALETLSGADLLRGQMPMWVITTVLGLAFLWRARRWDLFGAGRWSVGKAVGLGMGFGLGLRILLVLYVTIFSLTGLGATQALPQVAQLLTAIQREWGTLAMVGATAVFVPLLEELVFRGVLLGALARHIPFWAANLLQAACFTLVHDDHRLIPFFMGFALVAGLLVRRSGGLLGALCLHALNNLLACLGLLAVRHWGG